VTTWNLRDEVLVQVTHRCGVIPSLRLSGMTELAERHVPPGTLEAST